MTQNGDLELTYSSTNLVKDLLKKGANVNAQGGNFNNALQLASFKGYDKIVDQLLQYNANVNLRGGYFCTALQAASAGGQLQIVEKLLEYGAD
jgi:ankyrin repeat protein